MPNSQKLKCETERMAITPATFVKESIKGLGNKYQFSKKLGQGINIKHIIKL